jgi:HSP20 family protein
MPRNLARFDPLAELSNLQKQFFEDGLLGPFRGSHRPTMDVYTEDDKRMTIEIHLPDFDESDIHVDLDGDAVVLQAERHEKEEDRKKQYVVRETASSVYRKVTLPAQADQERIAAEFEHGVLKVVIPFREASSPKRIRIGNRAA